MLNSVRHDASQKNDGANSGGNQQGIIVKVMVGIKGVYEGSSGEFDAQRKIASARAYRRNNGLSCARKMVWGGRCSSRGKAAGDGVKDGVEYAGERLLGMMAAAVARHQLCRGAVLAEESAEVGAGGGVCGNHRGDAAAQHEIGAQVVVVWENDGL